MHDATWEVTTKVPPGRSQRARQRWLAPPFHPISILEPTVQRVLGIVVVFDVVVVVFVLFLVVVISVFFSDLHFKTRDGCQGGWRGFWCLGVIGSRDQTKKGRLQEACLRHRVASLHKSTLTCAFKYPMCKGFIC